MSLKPMFKWSGGKGDEIKRFKHHIPESYDTYLEPFIGGGAVFFHLEPKRAIITDVHRELVDFYTAINKGKSAEIYNFLSEHPNEEAVYYDVRNNMPITDYLENAKRFYYLRKTCYRGMLRYNKSGKFNIPYGRYKTYNFELLKDERYENLLKNTKVECKDFTWMFENYNSSDNFMFLDPPYDSKFTDYGYCSFDREDQKRLADCFKKTNIKCLMIIGKTDFICDLYDGYIVEEYDKRYRFKLHSKRIGDEINTQHLVIKNY